VTVAVIGKNKARAPNAQAPVAAPTQAGCPPTAEFEWQHRDDDGAEEPLAAAAPRPPHPSEPQLEPEWGQRVRVLVEQYMDFVWRSLRRLGVPAADCDDGCQRVWLVVSRKLPLIAPNKERSYIFSVAVRVASEMRRKGQRLQEVQLQDDWLEEQGHASSEAGNNPFANPERHFERQRARQLLDSVLSGMSWELRTAFVMFELEGISTPEIAQALGVSRGTAASRLRLARQHFQRAIARHETQQRGRGVARLVPADEQTVQPPDSEVVGRTEWGGRHD
jgi:RNA polymerase sigma-70 factor, ECF subfamily